jgi:hypothetical protein
VPEAHATGVETMKDALPARLPSPLDAEQRRNRFSARLTAGLLLLLGFGFTGSALLGNAPEPATVAPAVQTSAATAPTGPQDATIGPAESPEVTAAVRHWVWETPSASRPAGVSDTEELWLPR